MQDARDSGVVLHEIEVAVPPMLIDSLRRLFFCGLGAEMGDVKFGQKHAGLMLALKLGGDDMLLEIEEGARIQPAYPPENIFRQHHAAAGRDLCGKGFRDVVMRAWNKTVHRKKFPSFET